MAICSKCIAYIPPGRGDNGYWECCGRFFCKGGEDKERKCHLFKLKDSRQLNLFEDAEK